MGHPVVQHARVKKFALGEVVAVGCINALGAMKKREE